MKVDKTRIRELIAIMTRIKGDPLREFVAKGSPIYEELDNLRMQNFNNLVILCRGMKVRYVCIAHTEICGCEGKNDSGGTWPAMWYISHQLDISGGCGNHDQHQTDDKGIWFPADKYGCWDLQTMEMLTEAQEKELKFRRVTSRERTKEYV